MTIRISTNLVVMLVALAWEALLALQDALPLWLQQGLVPKKYEPLAMLAVAFIPKALSVLAHYSNPNGTPASEAYPKLPPEVQASLDRMRCAGCLDKVAK
jgi:hypothetical protein